MSSEKEKAVHAAEKTPDTLDSYIRVTNTGIWIVLMAIIAILVLVFVWAAFGTIAVTGENGAVEMVHPIKFLLN